MIVKNTGSKVIGFGNLTLLPGEMKPLPKGFDEKHPVVKFYIEKNFLAVVDGKAEAERLAAVAKAEADRIAAEKAEADRKAEAAAKLVENEREKQESGAKSKSLSAMNLESLRAWATEKEIDFAPTDTRDILKQKITEKLQSEQG